MSYVGRMVRGTGATLARGLAPALLTGVLPIVLVPILPKSEYVAWSLAVSLAAYVGVLALGVQSVVSVLASDHSDELHQADDSLPLVAALEFLAPLMLLAFGAAVLLALVSGSVFSGILPRIRPQFGAALVLLTVASIANVFGMVIWGFAIGVNRLKRTLRASLLGRLVSFGTAAITATRTDNLAWIACAYSIPIVASLPPQLLGVRLGLDRLRRGFSHARRANRAMLRRRYVKGAQTLGGLSIGMLLVAGSDGTIVGFFDYPHTGLYVLAASIVTLVTTATASWTPSYLSDSPSFGEPVSVTRMVNMARISTSINFLASCWTLPIAALLFHLLLPASDSRLAYAISAWLLIANAIRQWPLVPVLSAVAAEHYDRLVITACFEGVVNLAISIAMCVWIGAIGVAIGTLLAGVATIPFIVHYTFSDSEWKRLGRRRILDQALTRPSVVLLVPTITIAVAPLLISFQPIAIAAQVAICIAASAAALKFCATRGERAHITAGILSMFGTTSQEA